MSGQPKIVQSKPITLKPGTDPDGVKTQTIGLDPVSARELLFKSGTNIVYSSSSGMIGTSPTPIFNKVTIKDTPSALSDAVHVDYVNKYVNDKLQGLDVKESVRLATTVANENISLSGSLSVDGVAVSDGDRILVKNQTHAKENGIYIANTSGAWQRAADFNEPDEVKGAFVFVAEGTVNSAKGFVQTNNSMATVGVDVINFTQFNGTYAFEAGNGLTRDGNTLNVDAGLNFVTDMAGLTSVGSTGQTIHIHSSIEGPTIELLGDSLISEASTARSAELVLTSGVSAVSTGLVTEASTARSAELVLTDRIDGILALSNDDLNTLREIEDAFKNADNDISGSIVNLQSTLNSTISTEASTARSAELLLTTGVSAVSTGLVTEASTARSAELLLTTGVSAVSTGLVTEASTARSAELLLTTGVSAVSTGLVTEASTARSAELLLTSDVSAVSTGLVTEASTARSAELLLTTGLSTEVSKGGILDVSMGVVYNTGGLTTTSTPQYVGQVIVSGSDIYIAIGTNSTSDWKKIAIV